MLGNPTAYQITKILIKDHLTPSLIAERLELSLPTVSTVLRHLREIDLVRYENLREGKVYFIEDNTIAQVLGQLQLLVKRLRSREY